ncbi:hypothetical protein EII34_09440 [Arachnia propionica]|uniref:Uncharacterized protein n=1 Tax=Arachnia propionica TaxID=1750 RepID=A0A3P1T5K1_9ACTN|nr:hypothetical protein [Arachnia propionica]RRD04751.1 hypothetical protein EII34_09440 [Arachnia propionica]
MRLGEILVNVTSWDEVEVLRGTGAELEGTLRKFVHAKSTTEISSLWDELEGVAFAQNTLYGASVPVVDVMLAVLADHSTPWHQMWAAEVLRFILMADSATNPSLRETCVNRVQAGKWLLASLACHAESVDTQEALIEVLDTVDPTLAQITATASRPRL